jgi:protein-tyrosine phosphatase
MFDIHSHLLPFVDDGSSSIDDSVNLLKKAVDEGVSKIILTPHFNIGEYKLSKERIVSAFSNFSNHVKSLGVDIELYLGEEVFCNSKVYDLIKNGEVITMNNTKYLLTEFDYFEDTDVYNYCYNILSFGYVPIIAHVERYRYLDFDKIVELKDLGVLVQVNANSVSGEDGKVLQKRMFSLIKNNLVDFVATDIHTRRDASLKLAQNVVLKKFKEEVANKLFIENAKILFN